MPVAFAFKEKHQNWRFPAVLELGRLRQEVSLGDLEHSLVYDEFQTSLGWSTNQEEAQFKTDSLTH